jgi:hypothetical protein
MIMMQNSTYFRVLGPLEIKVLSRILKNGAFYFFFQYKKFFEPSWIAPISPHLAILILVLMVSLPELHNR